MTQPRVLVTGASGMLGAHLVQRLLRTGHSVAATGRGPDVPLRLANLPGFDWYPSDLLDLSAVHRMVAASLPTHVVHLASTPFNPPPAPSAHVAVNIVGTHNLLLALSKTPGVRIVYTGSAAQYGSGNSLQEGQLERPTTVLGSTKSCAANLLHTYGRMFDLMTVELRLFTPYGPMERPTRLIPHTILSALQGKPIQLGNGRQQRDYTFVDDVVEAILAALWRPLESGVTLNVCSGHPWSVADVVAQILDLMGKPVPALFDALPTRPDEIWHLSGSPIAAQKALSWTPTVSMSEGLARVIDWYSQHRTLAETLT